MKVRREFLRLFCHICFFLFIFQVSRSMIMVGRRNFHIGSLQLQLWKAGLRPASTVVCQARLNNGLHNGQWYGELGSKRIRLGRDGTG